MFIAFEITIHLLEVYCIDMHVPKGGYTASFLGALLVAAKYYEQPTCLLRRPVNKLQVTIQ